MSSQHKRNYARLSSAVAPSLPPLGRGKCSRHANWFSYPFMRRQLFTCVTLLALGLASEALAQRTLAVAPAPGGEARVALVIGNSAYKESPLANPVNDATDMAAALHRLGFKVIRRLNANTRDIRQVIREFGSELRRSEVGLFYFAGHGVQVRGNNYLVPVGADIQNEADVEDLAIDANFVMRTMEESQVKVSIAILDACRNNPFARGFRSASRGLAQMNAATGSLVAFATAPGSIAADGTGRNGIYTKHLLTSLNDADTDILKVFQRTRAAVVKETGGRQTPWESTSLIGDFYFRPPASGTQVATTAQTQTAPPARLQDAAEIEQQLWDAIKDSRDARDFEDYLSSYPNGRFTVIARTRLRALQGTQVTSAKPTTGSGAAAPAAPAASNANIRLAALGPFNAGRGSGPIRIGFGIALTGPSAPSSKPLLDSLVAWAQEVNRQGGIRGRKVELTYYDDQSSASVMRASYTKLIYVDRVDLLVAPYGIELLAALEPQIRGAVVVPGMPCSAPCVVVEPGR